MELFLLGAILLYCIVRKFDLFPAYVRFVFVYFIGNIRILKSKRDNVLPNHLVPRIWFRFVLRTGGA